MKVQIKKRELLGTMAHYLYQRASAATSQSKKGELPPTTLMKSSWLAWEALAMCTKATSTMVHVGLQV